MEVEMRKAAIRRYILQGESPKNIYNSLNRSKQWFYKWLKRYHTEGKDWYKNRNFGIQVTFDSDWRTAGRLKAQGLNKRAKKTDGHAQSAVR